MVYETDLKLTQYAVLGPLPDPFLRDDGTRLHSPDEWRAHRASIYAKAVEFQYGVVPAPEFLTLEPLYLGNNTEGYRITTGPRSHPVSFTMRVFKPAKVSDKIPVVVDGDLCFDYAFQRDWRAVFTDAGIALCMFNRTELAHDIAAHGRAGQLFDAYPDHDFGTLAAWAWGFSRCVDALLQLDYVAPDAIVFTGHSRGGKTAALAGAIDERAAIVAPNDTNAGSCSCYRIHMSAMVGEREKRSETLADLCRTFPHWLGTPMFAYTEREADLPFDCHYLKALVAPRTLFIAEAEDDIWTNPIGSWMTTQAAGEVYRFLGAPEQLIWSYRPGGHRHDIEDVRRLVAVIEHKLRGKPLPETFFRAPFPAPTLIYDWRAPTQ